MDSAGPPTFNVSPSLIKAFYDYLDGNSCGFMFQVVYLDRDARSKETDAQVAGQWVEFMSTGAKPSGPPSFRRYPNGAPKPGMLKEAEKKEAAAKEAGEEPFWASVNPPPPDGDLIPDEVLNAATKDLEAKYRVLIKQANLFREWYKECGFETIEVGHVVTSFLDGIPLKHIEDVRAIAKKDLPEYDIIEGDLVIIDIKSTGKIDDNWGDYSWGDRDLESKDKLMLQPKFYIWHNLKTTFTKPKFLFYVMSSDSINAKVVVADVSDHTMSKIDGTNPTGRGLIQFVYHEIINKYGNFEVRAHLTNCSNCPASEFCLFKTNIPRSIRVHL